MFKAENRTFPEVTFEVINKYRELKEMTTVSGSNTFECLRTITITHFTTNNLHKKKKELYIRICIFE